MPSFLYKCRGWKKIYLKSIWALTEIKLGTSDVSGNKAKRSLIPKESTYYDVIRTINKADYSTGRCLMALTWLTIVVGLEPLLISDQIIRCSFLRWQFEVQKLIRALPHYAIIQPGRENYVCTWMKLALRVVPFLRRVENASRATIQQNVVYEHTHTDSGKAPLFEERQFRFILRVSGE